MSQFLHDNDNNDAKTIALPRVFSENIRAKNPDENVFENTVWRNCW